MAHDLYSHNRNWGARIMEYQYKGYRMVSLENRLLRISIAADKGTDIIEFLYKPLDVDFMWRSYQGLRGSRNTLPTSPNIAGPFLDYYPGGRLHISGAEVTPALTGSSRGNPAVTTPDSSLNA